MFQIRSIQPKGGHRPHTSSFLAIAAVVAALTLFIVLAGTSAQKTEAAGISDGLGQSPTIMNDFYNDCAPFSNFGTYYDPYGMPYYQPLPIYGNPYTQFNQCINYGINNFNCSNYGYGYNIFNPCVTYCSTNTQQVYPGGPQVCPGPPATILFAPSPTSVSCGGASNLQVVVLDANGLRVLDGATVNFTTSLGYVSSTDGTQDGIAYTSLTIPPKQAGQAAVTATAGGATAQKLIQVTC